MLRAIAYLLATVSALADPLTLAQAADCSIPKPLNAAYLSDLTEIPYRSELGGGGDKCYWEIVSLGLPVVPELLDLVDDPTVTPHLVPLFGGSYAIGDIALSLLTDIVRVPVVELLPQADRSDEVTCGYCVYWRFVRASPDNRSLLRGFVAAWLAEHSQDLEWVVSPGLTPGGQYALSPGDDA